ncbi:CotH kinase family protein [Fibrobacter sp. UWB5]|uniref:CotH kinase family protein n=1 Tax=Fibrobacter sp. UWB5 TaxID=1964360 RepID=UPI000B5231B6|nr:CotH kinase family protein [Fibrobacter sp. UWB5]OWV14318.1 hypothetical protein B7989_02340 [Fibrobacter sp. UWB5]
MRYHFAKPLPLLLGIVICCLGFGCSNSERIDNEIVAFWDVEEDATPLFTELNYLPIDDSEYPYAGIPRIVIETENHREIKDRETEIPAKLQVWGADAPESEVMELTIRGRGNTTWSYPKKPYAIKFNEKQAFLGMPKAKKWVMLANYRDRTLIRNAVAFEIARRTSLKWTPSGRFVDVFFNRKYIGNYYICEKVEVKKNRLELDENGFLIEFDTHYDEDNKFRTSFKNLPANIKYPKELSEEQFNYIQDYIDTIECILYGKCNSLDIQQYLNLQSLASYWIIYEIAQNDEMHHPKSIFVHKDTVLNFGPIWDFDWQTFTPTKKGLRNTHRMWIDALKKQDYFLDIVKNEWNTRKNFFIGTTNFIDSIAALIYKSNEANLKKWPIDISADACGDEKEDFYTSINMLKSTILNRITELDSLINQL